MVWIFRTKWKTSAKLAPDSWFLILVLVIVNVSVRVRVRNANQKPKIRNQPHTYTNLKPTKRPFGHFDVNDRKQGDSI